MGAPTYTAAPNPGNLIPLGTAIAGAKILGTLLDLTTDWEGQVTVALNTGTGTIGTSPGVRWDVFHVVGSQLITTGGAAGITSITVANGAQFVVGEVIALKQAGAWTGETVTISAIAGNVLTISATQYAYAANDLVYKIEQTASTSVQPASSTGTYAASNYYSKTMYISQGKYFLRAVNLDSTDATYQVDATLDTLS